MMAAPDPSEVARRQFINEAAGLLGKLYIEVVRVSQEPMAISDEALEELGRRVAREGMAAGRRLRKAAVG